MGNPDGVSNWWTSSDWDLRAVLHPRPAAATGSTSVAGRHCANAGAAYARRSTAYRARHVDTDRQPGRRPVDEIPDQWFDPWIERGPDDPDLGVR